VESLLDDASQQDSPVQEGGLSRETEHGLARVYEVDPLRDRRWRSLVEQHPHASVYHTVEWLELLHRTYGYQPVAFTNSPPTSDLNRALLFGDIRSWLTGHRRVSLPFSDYCEPLCDWGTEFEGLISHLKANIVDQGWKYLEIRPVDGGFDSTAKKLGFETAGQYIMHRLDLKPTVEEIFRQLHKDSAQRRVRHAERFGVVELAGKSQRFLDDFYRLLVRTRARHHLPPQPYSWFRNLLDGMGSAADLRIAYMEQIPVAAVLILHFKDKSYYKYGCSDERFHHLGSIPFLLWRAILNAKSIGSRTFELGRTGVDQHGLLQFKNHWAPVSELVTYWRFPPGPSFSSIRGWKLNVVKRVCAYLPDRLLRIAGTLLYPHIG
jgi:GNAT acetyltransferase-like protein